MPLAQLERVVRAEARFRKAAEAYERAVVIRRAAMLAAHEAGHSIHEIAAVIGVTHEFARRQIRAVDHNVRPYRRGT